MAQSKQSRGQCAFCGYETTKGSMLRHLAACPQRRECITTAAQAQRKPETLYHLRVQSARSSDFWFDIEIRGAARLGELDNYLRAIWLECCGHLSEFWIGKAWSGQEVPMEVRVHSVFKHNVQLCHIYDFGTSSETHIKATGQREGMPLTNHPIVLMSRNLMPEAVCIECGDPATHLCMECLIEANVWGVLCATHAHNHPHHDYGEPLELVNSPRLGMCGYTGPADPPY